MPKMIYVGSLPFTATDDEVRGLFSKHGTVHTVKLVVDRDTGRPRGFCFVEMENGAAHVAISVLSGTDFRGRSLLVIALLNNSGSHNAESPKIIIH